MLAADGEGGGQVEALLASLLRISSEIEGAARAELGASRLSRLRED